MKDNNSLCALWLSMTKQQKPGGTDDSPQPKRVYCKSAPQDALAGEGAPHNKK